MPTIRVERPGKRTAYILEIARPDQRSLSTLIIQFAGVKNLEDEEKAIQALLLSLVFNGGNWPLEELQEINHVRLRHTRCKPYRWAERVYNGMYWFWA